MTVGVARISSPPIQESVLQRLGDMGAADVRAAFEIGDGAGQAAYALDGACREGQSLDGAFEDAVAVDIEAGHPAEVGRGQSGVRSRPAAVLPLARGLYTSAHRRRALARLLAGQLAVGDGRDLDVHVDAIEQRPRQLGPVGVDGWVWGK
jgi:hypothetical protein